MADMRLKTRLGANRAVRGDLDGRVVTREPVLEFSFKGTGAISLTTDLANRFPDIQFEVVMVEAKISAAPTTAENFTVTLQAHRGATEWDVVIYSRDPSVGATTSLVNIWEHGYAIMPGDELIVAYTNTDANTVAGRLVVRPVS